MTSDHALPGSILSSLGFVSDEVAALDTSDASGGRAQSACVVMLQHHIPTTQDHIKLRLIHTVSTKTGSLHAQIIWPKINYLSSSIKLSPWYLQGSKALVAIEAVAGNTSAQVAVSDAASFRANATLDGPSAMLQAFAADAATSTEAIATTVSPSLL